MRNMKHSMNFSPGRWIMIAVFAMGHHLAVAVVTVDEALKKPDAWFQSAEGRDALNNVLSHQTPRGDWPKNRNTAGSRFTGDIAEVRGTFDSKATTRELRLLARAFNATENDGFCNAFLKGLRHVLDAQYDNGGWPQYAPPPERSYHRHVTFNDHSMVRLLEFVRDVAEAKDFNFVDPELREACRRAYARGIDCILESQIRVEGRLTVWCAQHDATTLEPRPARSYELVSLSGAESAGVLRFLMGIEDPSPEAIRAVHAGVAWFESAAIEGVRVTRVDGDKRVIDDPDAKPLWARFYDIETNRPIFSGRDGIKKFALAEIEAERRNGYAWYGSWGAPVLADYDRWTKRVESPAPALNN